MSRHYPQKHFSHRRKRSYVQRQETTFQTAKRYGIVAVISGLGIALATNAWESAQRRQAFLDALPAGYLFSGCNDVRAAGVAPLYRYEPGFSDRLDGDGDGIGCEPHRSN